MKPSPTNSASKTLIMIVLFLLAFAPMYLGYLALIDMVARLFSSEGFNYTKSSLILWIILASPFIFTGMPLVWWMCYRTVTKERRLKVWLHKFDWIALPIFFGGAVSLLIFALIVIIKPTLE